MRKAAVLVHQRQRHLGEAEDAVALGELPEDLEEALILRDRLGAAVLGLDVVQVRLDGLLQGHGGGRRLEVAFKESGLQLEGLLAGDLEVPGLQAAALVLAVEPEVGSVGLLLAAGTNPDAVADQDGFLCFGHAFPIRSVE